LYLKGDGTWTASFQEAERFDDLRAVFAAKERFNIEKAELILVMHQEVSQYDVTIPL
jgi:hypothetical protein